MKSRKEKIRNLSDYRSKGKPREQQIDEVRRSIISRVFTEEYAEDRELWWSKISMG